MNYADDNTLVEALRQNERAAFNHVYDAFFPELAHYILKNSGNLQDAEDNFQESILILMRKIQNPEFSLTAAVKTFLYAINKNLWLKKLRDQKKIITLHLEEELVSLPDEAIELPLDDHSNWLSKVLNSITDHCLILITRIFIKQDTPEYIIKDLGYKNAHTYNNQKYKCILQLRKVGKKIPQAG